MAGSDLILRPPQGKTKSKPNEVGLILRGGARERVQFSAKPETEQSGLCDDVVGVDYCEGPPVPIPNTEVKLVCADNSMWVTACEDR